MRSLGGLRSRERRGASPADGSSPGAPILVAEGLTKTFETRGSNPVTAIAELSFQVERGEFFAVVGPSGSGKTTLLRMIAGLLPATDGRVIVNGRVVDEPLRDFGIAFQHAVLLPWRSALANVLLPIEMLGRDAKAYRDRAMELLNLMGLAGFELRRPRELSGGMQQRVALCRALIHDPTILLMDEPFGALDEFTRQALNDYLLTLWLASHKTVVFVTHSVAEAVYLSDRVAVLSARPARLVDIVPVDLPRPRDPDLRYTPAFGEQVKRVQDRLRPT